MTVTNSRDNVSEGKAREEGATYNGGHLTEGLAYLLFGGSAQPHAGQEQVPPFFSTLAHFTVSYIDQ